MFWTNPSGSKTWRAKGIAKSAAFWDWPDQMLPISSHFGLRTASHSLLIWFRARDKRSGVPLKNRPEHCSILVLLRKWWDSHSQGEPLKRKLFTSMDMGQNWVPLDLDWLGYWSPPFKLRSPPLGLKFWPIRLVAYVAYGHSSHNGKSEHLSYAMLYIYVYIYIYIYIHA